MKITCILLILGLTLPFHSLPGVTHRAGYGNMPYDSLVRHAERLLNDSRQLRNTDRETARELAAEAYRLFSLCPDTSGMAYALKEAGILDYLTGNPPQAYRNYEEAIRLFRLAGDSAGMSACFHNMALVHQDQGQLDSALFLLKTSLESDRRRNDTAGIAGSCNAIGNIFFIMGDYEQALGLYLESLSISRGTGNASAITDALLNLGMTYRMLERYDMALECIDKALAMAGQNGDKYSLGVGLLNRGQVFHARNMPDSALSLYQHSLSIRSELDDVEGTGICLRMIGTVYEEAGAFTAANEMYFSALKLSEELGHRRLTADYLIRIGHNLAQMGHAIKAIRYIGQGCSIAQWIGAPYEMMQGYSAFTLAWASLGKTDSAERYIGLYARQWARLFPNDSAGTGTQKRNEPIIKSSEGNRKVWINNFRCYPEVISGILAITAFLLAIRLLSGTGRL
ncbi:MAG: tetratricopeptide repeat protein [Bacteroidales bacterium]|nr:tetratricopeptide repeat protein [Bacteroidales bacterium]